MGIREANEVEEWFARRVNEHANMSGHAGGAAPLRDYFAGSMPTGEQRKSVEPMGALTAPTPTRLSGVKLRSQQTCPKLVAGMPFFVRSLPCNRTSDNGRFAGP